MISTNSLPNNVEIDFGRRTPARRKPEEIYYFKEDAKYPGYSIGELMFKDYNYLYTLFKTIVNNFFKISYARKYNMGFSEYLSQSKKGGRKSELHRHLEFYLDAGEKHTSNKGGKIICPHCGQEEVRYFNIIDQISYGFVVDHDLIFCTREECRKIVTRAPSTARLRTIKKSLFRFSVMEIGSIYQRPQAKPDFQRSIAELYKKVFGLPDIVTAKMAFDFFTS